MTSTLRSLLFAAGAATALSASAARACDDRPPPPPAFALAPADYEPGPAAAVWQGEHWRWHDGGWEERRELEREYRALDRARFHRRWGWDRRRAARFESWYGPTRRARSSSAALGGASAWGR
jgi:hypothetical protein